MFISFEGLDGSGKTTQIEQLVRGLESEGRTVLRVREPGGTPLSEHVRTLLLDPDADVSPLAELLLFSAARAQLVERVIRPALARGEVIVSDRFYDSTTAYQGGGRALASLDWLRAFHGTVTGGLAPDVTFLLRMAPDAAAERRYGREGDRMEGAGLAFFRRVAEAYDAVAVAEPERFVVLDAALPRDSIARRVAEVVRARMGAGNPH